MAGVGQEEAKWLLQFTNSNYSAEDGEGRPWGDGTAMAERAKAGKVPWDEGCGVKAMIGGYAAMGAIRDTFEKAIAEAETAAMKQLPFGQRGHVYITGLQFNAQRDLSRANTPWTEGQTATLDQSAMGLVLRMLGVGIGVRLLLWMPNSLEDSGGAWHIAGEHWNVATVVQKYNATLEAANPGATGPFGVVALDLRTATPVPSSLHQKGIVVRVGDIDVAFCGGVDLAFTRRDFGLAADEIAGKGDWQSGTLVPLAKEGWPHQPSLPGGYPPFPQLKLERFPEALPANVYGSTYLHWHDHHLMLGGPIVATLEQQFAERWIMDTNGKVSVFDPQGWVDPKKEPTQPEEPDEVILTSAACIGEAGGEKFVLPLPEAKTVPGVPGGATVQMWRTIPLRYVGGSKPPFQRGEFTVMAGVSNAVSKATQLITICDQYFWSEALALQLAARLNAVKTLKLLIFLPPSGAETPFEELGLRRKAMKAMWKNLEADAQTRVRAFDLWSPSEKRGVYVHAKSHTYDDALMVCGSANMNRRSLECDAELDCAVLSKVKVISHLSALFRHFTGVELKDEGKGMLEAFWKGVTGKSIERLRPDPFLGENVGNLELPNGEKLTYATEPAEFPFEVTSIGSEIEKGTCKECQGDPGEPGHLNEITFLLERCHKGTTWPWRTAAPFE